MKLYLYYLILSTGNITILPMAIVTHILCLVSGHFFLQWNVISTFLISAIYGLQQAAEKSEQKRHFLHGQYNLIYFPTD